MVPKKVGGELRRRRLELRLSQEAVGKRVGVSRAYIGNVENGVDWEPAADVLVKWALALGLDPVDLLRSMGRLAPDETAALDPVASSALLAAIREAVAAGVRQGVEEAIRELGVKPRRQTH